MIKSSLLILGALSASVFTIAAVATSSDASYEERQFEFSYQDLTYVGEVMVPDAQPKGLIVIIPGHGPTDFVEGEDWIGEREFFVEQDYAVAYWDKAGTGLSEGEYDHNQSIESSAEEAVAALASIKALGLPNSENLGMWGISRAGWIVPNITELSDDVKFWISVSGTSVLADERYRTQANLKVEGRSDEEVAMLMSEWDDYQRILVRGGTFEEFLATTSNLMSDPYFNSNNFVMTEEILANIQGYYQSSGMAIDEETNLPILYPNMEQALTDLSIPVLAILGRLDTLVDWQATSALYSRAAENGGMALTTVYLDDCNHVMQQAVTGGTNEEIEPGTPVCEGYYETMETWLNALPARP